MRTVLDLTYGVAGQSIFYDAPEGRPTSVTSITVFRAGVPDDGLSEAATTGSAAVETNPSTTTDAACGTSQADPRHVPVTATTGFVADRDYLIIDTTTGVKEWIEVGGITSADSVDARNPLHNDYAIGSAVVSTRMSISMLDSWTADRNRIGPSISTDNKAQWITDPHYRVRWVYVVAGVTHVADTYFNLVRYPGHHGVEPQDIDDMLPGWIARLPVDHKKDQGRRFIDEAYREVKIDMAAAEVNDSDVADSEIVDELVRHKAVQMSEWARYLAGNGDNAKHVEAEKVYANRMQSFITLCKRVAERNIGGGASRGKAIGISRR